MNNKKTGLDWPLLIFLAGVCHVKLYIKVVAIVFYLFWVFYSKYKMPKANRLNYFYLAIAITGTLSSLLQDSFDFNGYWVGYLFGMQSWLMAGLTSYLLYVAVVNLNEGTLDKTIKGFFALNIIVSLGNLVYLIILSGHLVPYWYWDAREYFGGSTGDHIYGIFQNISVANAMVCMLGVIYFLYKKNIKWALACELILLLCTSNLTLIFFIVTLLILLIAVNERTTRLNVMYLIFGILVVYPTITPGNIQYVDHVYEQQAEQAEKKSRIIIYNQEAEKEAIMNDMERGVNTIGAHLGSTIAYYRMNKAKTFVPYVSDLKYYQDFIPLKNTQDNVELLDPWKIKALISRWYDTKYENTPLTTYTKPFKLYSNLQTMYYMNSSKKNLLLGAGIGNFSSKLALKMTGLGLQGSYPNKYIYASDDFIRYQLYTELFVFTLPISEHSIINMINSVYNQVGGEYGLLGILVVVVFYLWYFIVNRKKISWMGWTLLPVMLVFFQFDYWFEMLNITVLFELFMFKDIYKRSDA